MINSVGALMGTYGALKNSTSGVSSGRAQQAQKQQLIKEQYQDIFEHEQAHKAAAGQYGGAIVIERNAEGIPVGGHVDIEMPVLDKENPENTIKHADIVIKSAMAPSDPSDQDYKVAAEAESIRSQATSEKNKKGSGASNPQKPGQKLNLVA